MPTFKIIGRYEVKSEIARGGMATVYHAYDPRFERDVAIKVLPRTLLHDPQFRARFEREAKTIAILEHPAIVPVYDFGEEDGQPYIVMRYMSGGSLTERIQQGSLSLQETAQLVTRLAPALDAAHHRNVIHRDLKPGNILFDQYGNAYLSDFGIARLSTSTTATLTGESILGTPGYMSPEQVQGEKSIDGRSDIYALGVLIYQMLVGHIPYQADTPAKVMMMHLLQPVPNIRDARTDLPAGANALINRAMAKRPEDRFATASELAKNLEALLLELPGKDALIAPRNTTITSAVVQPAHGIPTVSPADETRVAPEKTAVSSPTVVTPNENTSATEAAKDIVAAPPVPVPVVRRKPRAAAIGMIAVLVVLLIVAVATLALGRNRVTPLAALKPSEPGVTITHPTITEAPSATSTEVQIVLPIQSTPTSELNKLPIATEAPAITPTQEQNPTITPTPAAPVIGGADKIAYLNGNEIWIANMDGSQVEQLTDDASTKSNLQWAPNGQAVNFISGKCVNSVHLSDKRIDTLVCFNFLQYFKAFEISSDGKQVAASLDNQMYILPYDLELLKTVAVRGDLARIAECKDFAPYERYVVKFPRWSRDGKRIAKIMWGIARDIGPADTVMIATFDLCTPRPDIIDSFPAERFQPEEYKQNPTLLNFGWDGLNMYAITTLVRNNGFGKLYIYNGDIKKGQGPVEALGECCYRDPIFTPDGSHILFAYQDYTTTDKTIYLYLIPFGSLGTGANYAPLDLPAFDPSSLPQPALRTAP